MDEDPETGGKKEAQETGGWKAPKWMPGWAQPLAEGVLNLKKKLVWVSSIN